MLQRVQGRFESLQRFALRTQFFPFDLLYRLLYRLAIRLCARRLGRLPGVLCVYLRRGLASSGPVYGLSDIDLLVLVGGEHRERSAARVRNCYAALRRVIPMLAEGELALYTPDEFQSLYTYSPFYRNRFDLGRRQWRRLCGEDAFRYLPAPYDRRPYLATFELSSIWRYLSQELLPGDPRPAYLRRYVAYKMIADAASAALAAGADDEPDGRESALARAAEAYPQAGANLKQAGAWRRNLLSSDDLPVDDVLETFRFLAHAAVNGDRAEPLAARTFRIMALPSDHLERYLGRGARTRIQEACAALGEVERAVLTPRLNFDPLATVGLEPAALAGATVDSFDLLVAGQRLPSAEHLREFNRRLGHLTPRLNTFFCDGELALALQPVSGWAARDRRSSPELFAYIAGAGREGLVSTAGGLSVDRPFERSDAVQVRARTLLSLFGRPEVFQMSARDFFAVFWEALRAACVALQADKAAAEVPVTSDQVVDTLARLGVPGQNVLGKILEEYWKDLREEPSEIARYKIWAAEYAGTVKGRVDPGQPGTGALPEQPVTRLSMSVVIATRNRAGMLEHALDSLCGQKRLPDEVVVVDNGSADATAAVALSFQDRLNLKVVREERVGIPHARNTGIRAASGDIVAFIDDDCEAEPAWLGEMERPFLEDPHVASAGGNLVPIGGQPEVVARFYRSRMSPETNAERGPAR